MRLKVINIFILVLLVLSSSVFPSKANANGSVIDIAKQYIGSPYKYGGTSPSGFDCSGFVQFVFNQVGVNVPRATTSQWQVGKSISRGELQPGDIVFFSNTYKAGISHDGIYIGGNKFIHASSSQGITITSLNSSYWGPKYSGARRVTNGLVTAKPVIKKSEPKEETVKKQTVKKQNEQKQKVAPKPDKTIVVTSAKHYQSTLKDMEISPESFEVMISNQGFMPEVVSSEKVLFEADKVIFVTPTEEATVIPSDLIKQLEKDNVKVETIDYEHAEQHKILDKVGDKNYSFMFYGEHMPDRFTDTIISDEFQDLSLMLKKNGMVNGLAELVQQDTTMYYAVIRGIPLEELY